MNSHSVQKTPGAIEPLSIKKKNSVWPPEALKSKTQMREDPTVYRVM
jgi:hypothetical protein